MPGDAPFAVCRVAVPSNAVPVHAVVEQKFTTPPSTALPSEVCVTVAVAVTPVPCTTDVADNDSITDVTFATFTTFACDVLVAKYVSPRYSAVNTLCEIGSALVEHEAVKLTIGTDAQTTVVPSKNSKLPVGT